MFNQSAASEDITPVSIPADDTAPPLASLKPAPQNTGDPFLDHYFKRIDPRVAASFTPEQCDAIKSMFGARGIAKHSIELRRSLPIGRGRFYLVLLMGRERRTFGRLYGEGAVTGPFTILGYVITAALWTLPAVGAALLLHALL
jgi:hypothetical protein